MWIKRSEYKRLVAREFVGFEGWRRCEARCAELAKNRDAWRRCAKKMWLDHQVGQLRGAVFPSEQLEWEEEDLWTGKVGGYMTRALEGREPDDR